MAKALKTRVTILGATGSVGVNTLDVIARNSGLYEVFALTGFKNAALLFEQCAQFRPRFAVLPDPAAAQDLQNKLRSAGLATQVLSGAPALDEVASHPEVDAVMAAIVGAAGLPSCLAAARAGKRLLLANKEALVVGGSLFIQAVREGGATLLPIDSEHSAIFQSLPTAYMQAPEHWGQGVEKLILTASGGPFRSRPLDTFDAITPQEAVAHPNWVMGRKISVDSASMMNKALEVIEAHYLFAMPPERIEVVVHPQSIVHSMVQYRDTSVVAQLGNADMRVPIALGLSYPQRIASGTQPLDFTQLASLTFEALDPQRYPALGLAWQAMAAGEAACIALNAANEVTVEAFLNGGVRFTDIPSINHAVLTQTHSFVHTTALAGSDALSLEARLDIDQQARRAAQTLVAAQI